MVIQNKFFFRQLFFPTKSALVFVRMLQHCVTFATWYSICVTAYTAFNLIWVGVVSPVSCVQRRTTTSVTLCK
jgi:hypothetical protein